MAIDVIKKTIVFGFKYTVPEFFFKIIGNDPDMYRPVEVWDEIIF